MTLKASYTSLAGNHCSINYMDGQAKLGWVAEIRTAKYREIPTKLHTILKLHGRPSGVTMSATQATTGITYRYFALSETETLLTIPVYLAVKFFSTFAIYVHNPSVL